VSIATDSKFDEDLFNEEMKNLQGEARNILSSIRYGDCSQDGSAIVGKDNYIFIRDGSNRRSQQIPGYVSISDMDFERTCAAVDQAELECRKRGIALCTIVIPEKDVIYPEFSPNCDGIALGDRSVHKLISERPSVIYPWKELINHKHICGLYHKFDSHFNAFGGFVIANSIFNNVKINPIQWDDISFVHRQWNDDLSVKWYKNSFNRRTILEKYQETSIAQGNPLTGTHILFNSDLSENDDTAIIFGDSYSWNPDAGISRYLLYRFKKLHFIWSRSIDWTFVDQVQPKLVIIQSAERFLVNGLVRA